MPKLMAAKLNSWSSYSLLWLESFMDELDIMIAMI